MINFTEFCSQAFFCQTAILAKVVCSFVMAIFDFKLELSQVLPLKVEVIGNAIRYLFCLAPPCFSLSSIALSLFRLYGLPPRTLYTMPEHLPSNNTSLMEMQACRAWEHMWDPDQKFTIHSARSKLKQYSFGNLTSADLFIKETGQALFVNSCQLHGCDQPSCKYMPNNRDTVFSKLPSDVAIAQFKGKMARVLKEHSSEVVDITILQQCEFETLKEGNMLPMQNYIQEPPPTTSAQRCLHRCQMRNL